MGANNKTILRQKELWTKFENHLFNEGVTDKRIQKLKFMFITLERGLKKPFKDCERADIELFINSLHRDGFRKIDGQVYSGSSKSDIKKFLKQFYKWFMGGNETYPLNVSWLKTNIRKDEQPKEKDVLSLDEILLFANSFNKIDYKILSLLLFDSGFRIQEMLSVKKKDLTFEEFDEGKKCFWINCNESKTITRKIPIPLFTNELELFFNSSYMNVKKEDDPLFSISYSNVLNCFKANGLKVFGKDKSISPHVFRHSSATYYSKEYDGNMNLIAQRYGWSFSSVELKTYIRRSGAYQKIGAKKVFSNELVKIKAELEKEREARLLSEIQFRKELLKIKKSIKNL